MQARTWWINEPLVIAASNPTGEDLACLRAEGFSIVFSFLDEKKQPPKYDEISTAATGWVICSSPIEEGGVPSLEQLAASTALVKALPSRTKILMHCESGLGRTAFMAAAYWIAKGLGIGEAIARVRQAASEDNWINPQRESRLREYAKLQEGAGTSAKTDSSMLTTNPDRCKYDILRGRMDHEDGLITSRLNWLITSQSFLFAAYATLFRNGGAQQVTGQEVPLLVRLIPFIGITAGILIYTAIIAGVVALIHNRGLLRPHLTAVISRDHEFPHVQGPSWMVWLALLAPLLLPLAFVGAWITLLLGK
jgi:hypothetical protein